MNTPASPLRYIVLPSMRLWCDPGQDEAGVAGVAQDVVPEDDVVPVVDQHAAVRVEVRIDRYADHLVALDHVAARVLDHDRLAQVAPDEVAFDVSVLRPGDEGDAQLVVVSGM